MNEPIIEQEHLVFVIKDYVVDVNLAVETGEPLSKEVAELLDDFNGFDIKRLVERKGLL